jgi:hypothetical protein
VTAKGSGHRWAVDSIEDGIVRLEADGGRMLSLPVALLPAGVTEGQVLRVTRARGSEGDTVVLTIAVDARATSRTLAASKKAVTRTLGRSRRRDPGGDVSL